MRFSLSLTFAALMTVVAAPKAFGADTLKVSQFRYTGPYLLRQPVMVDTIGIDRQPYKSDDLLDTPVSLLNAGKGEAYTSALAPQRTAPAAVHHR